MDLEFFAAATLARLTHEGASLTLVVCTDGTRPCSPSEALAALRRRESDRAASVLGAKRSIFFEYAGGSLVVDDELRRHLVRCIRRERPELMLCHDPTTHWREVAGYVRVVEPDNRAAGCAALESVQPRAASRDYYPELAAEGLAPWQVREVWLFDTCRPNHFIDVAATRELKRAAISCHDSQIPVRIIEEAESEAEVWGPKAGFAAEAFRRLRLL
jgi:LmbE family N-acetylglucosaminyl deacetylase